VKSVKLILFMVLGLVLLLSNPAESQFIKTLGGGPTDDGWSVVQTSDGGLVVTGYTQSFGAGGEDLLLSKFDASGNHLWSRTLGGSSHDNGYSVIETSDSGFVVTGRTESFGAGLSDLLLSKFDASGNHLWSRTLGGTNSDVGRSVVQTSDGELVVTGYTHSFAGYYDLLLSKFDASGNYLWSRTLGGTSTDYSLSVVQTSDGGLVVTGITYSFGPGDEDLLLSKFDASGNHLWSRTLGGTSDEYGRSVVQTSDGGFVVTGSTFSFGAGDEDLLLSKFDFSGNTCMGEFVTPTVQSVSPTITSPTPTVTSPTPTIASPSPTVTSPTPTITVICDDRPPKILSITDVGNDQGRQVRVKWHRSYYDTVSLADTITEYGIWRRVDQYKGNLPGQDFVMREVENLDQMLENVASSKYGDRYVVTETGDLWDFIATVPAMQFPEYSYVAPTLADSTYEDGMYWSVFFVSAHTTDPLVHYDSDPDSGYSLDNIPPLPIRDLLVDPNSWFTLQWTVPGEYVGEHPISNYDIRYDTIPVGPDPQDWWDSAEACAGEGFFNLTVGQTDSFRVAKDNSWCHPNCYFAIKGLDDRPNYSEISNIVKFTCGDATGDGIVNIADVVYLVNYLFAGGDPPFPMAVGDATCDGVVNIADVVYLVNYLFAGGDPPCSP
jgi:hypothetical protein